MLFLETGEGFGEGGEGWGHSDGFNTLISQQGLQ